MLDVSYFQNSTSNTQLFQSGGSWQTWIKPRGAKTVNFFVVGAGGGGGGGIQASTGTKWGGAGGGTAGYVKLLINASLLPNILYILPGTGGTGGLGGLSPDFAGNATKSYVCLTPSTASTSNIICTSGAVASTGGEPGSVVSLTNGGAGETLATSTNMIFANLGNFLATAGQSGGNGGATTSSISVTSFLLTSNGGGGEGTGGGSNAGGPFPTISDTPVNTNGKNGLIFYKPIFGVSGGTGGGGGTTGGNGGDGAPGCGGGGGGSGTVSAGNGGRGGNGFVIITTNF